MSSVSLCAIDLQGMIGDSSPSLLPSDWSPKLCGSPDEFELRDSLNDSKSEITSSVNTDDDDKLTSVSSEPNLFLSLCASSSLFL